MDSFIKALSDSFTFFDTLSRAHSLETVLHTCSGTCLHCRTFSTLQFALVISPDVTLLLMGDLLHGHLHAIALLLRVIIALVPRHNLTQVAVYSLQFVLLYRATVLFLGILVSSLILPSRLLHYIYTAVRIESGHFYPYSVWHFCLGTS